MANDMHATIRLIAFALCAASVGAMPRRQIPCAGNRQWVRPPTWALYRGVESAARCPAYMPPTSPGGY